MYTLVLQPSREPKRLPTVLVTLRTLGAVVAALSLVAVLLSGCGKRPRTSESYRSVSPVPPREGRPIDQKTVLPQREKIIMKKPPSP
jgi:PBP1b-binding outer membrane lipoprotein LpoB